MRELKIHPRAVQQIEFSESMEPIHSIFSKIECYDQKNLTADVYAYSPFVLSNALQFNLVEEVPFMKGTYQTVGDMFNTLALKDSNEIVSFNIVFKDCLVSIDVEAGADIANGIEDILCNLFQHLPYISKLGDNIPEEVHIKLEKKGMQVVNACFTSWHLYFPEEIDAFSYHLEDKNIRPLNGLVW